MGDVVATIKEHAWLVGLILSTLAALFGGGWAGKGIVWTVARRRKRELDRLKKRRAWLQQLHDCDRTYYGWLLGGVLWVLVLLGAQLALEGYVAPPVTWPPERQHELDVQVKAARVVVGFIVYTIALNHVITDWLLRRRFDRTMARLERRIAKLEAKMLR
jgi:hypothetical protein